MQRHSEAIEVLMRSKAYVVKRLGSEDMKGVTCPAKGGQFTWKKHGGAVEAWQKATSAARWPGAEDAA